MTDHEFDEMMTSEMREIVADRRLPDGFSDRLAQSVKGSRIAWRIKAVICIAVVIGIGVSIMGYSRGTQPVGTTEAALIAADAPDGTAEVSSWFLLGYLRECFKRSRTNKKKEEE